MRFLVFAVLLTGATANSFVSSRVSMSHSLIPGEADRLSHLITDQTNTTSPDSSRPPHYLAVNERARVSMLDSPKWAVIWTESWIGFFFDIMLTMWMWYLFSTKCLYPKPQVDTRSYSAEGARSLALDDQGAIRTGILSCCEAPADVLHCLCSCTPLTLLDTLAALGMINKSDAKWLCCLFVISGFGTFSLMGTCICLTMPWLYVSARAKLGGTVGLNVWDILRGWCCPLLAICQLHRAVDEELGLRTGCCWDLSEMRLGVPVLVTEPGPRVSGASV